ncbi:DUF445 family protein [Halanaerobiaceae bacterium Z-7014]|uniref:DUF445 family protein n=1 Tax=Halonatronomonas betaini TaxID=2778430 RepID=A0A931AVP5_9FIRM|nr:DUF445 family protein [Halonatronomonas betaini]
MGLLNLFLNIIAGAANGYITNDVAVKMLFQKIGPFGGVLEKTREEFIYNLSELVEREIINHDTLAGEINNKEFKENLVILIEDFLMNELPEVISDIKLSDLPEVESTKDGFVEILSDEDMIFDLLISISKNTSFDQFISYKQFDNIFKEFLLILAELTNDEELMNEYVDFIRGFLLDIKVKDSEYGVLIDDFQEELIKNEVEIKRALNSLIKELGIRKIIETKLHEVYERPLDSIINDFRKENEETDFGIMDNIYEFLISPEGKELGVEVSSAFINSLEKVNLTLPEIFGETWDEELTPLLANELPVIIHEFLKWLQEHKDELEDLVDETIGEILENNRGLKNNLKQVLYKALSGKVASRYGLIGRLLKSFSEDDNLDKIAFELAEKIRVVLSNRELGWYVSRINKLELGDAGDWYDKIINIIYKWFKNSPSNKVYTSLSLKNILGPAPLQLFINQIDNLMINLITGFFQGERFKEFMIEFLNEIDIYKWLKNFVINIDFKSILRGKNFEDLSFKLYEKSGTYNLDSIIPDQTYSNLSRKISFHINNRVNDIFDQYSSEEINDILDKTKLSNSYHQIADKLANSLIDMAENNLDQLLSGKISQVVSDNLIDLSAEDMREVVEGFIGKELKPLTYFGGMLGGLAGLILNIFGGGIFSGAGITSILPAMLLFGFVGYITNVIAIWMIFRPYKPVSLAGKKMPFTPGLFARNQDRFAETLGDFVQNELLEPYRINRLLKEDRDEYQKAFKENIIDKDYRRLRAILKLLSSDFALKISEKITDKFEFIINSNLELLVQEFNNLEFSSDEINNFLRDFFSEFINTDGKIAAYLSKLLESILNNDNNLSLYFDKDFMNEITKNLVDDIFDQIKYDFNSEEMFLDFTNFKKDYRIEMLIKDYFSNKSLKEIFPLSTRRSLNNFITDYVLNIIRSGGLIKLISNLKIKDRSAGENERAFKLSLDKFLTDEYSSIQIFIIERIIGLIKSYRGQLKEFSTEILEEELIAGDEESNWLSQALFRGAYRFTGSKETVDELVDILIDEKLPYFIYENQKELENNFRPLIFNGINRLAKNFWDLTNRDDWQILIDKLFVRPELARTITVYTKEFIANCWNIRLPEFEFDFADSERNYEDFLNDFKNRLVFNIIDNEQVSKNHIINLFEIISGSIFNSQSPAVIFSSLTGLNPLNKGNLKRIIQPIIEKRNNEIKMVSDNTIKTIANIEKLKSPTNLFIEEELIDDILAMSKIISKNHELELSIIDSLDNYISNEAGHLNRYFSVETINHLSDYFIEAGFNSLENHFQSLLNSIAIKDVAINQVQLMEAEAIEDLFNSFAGSYLIRLKMYGWSGSVFGLLTGLITGI